MMREASASLQRDLKRTYYLTYQKKTMSVLKNGDLVMCVNASDSPRGLLAEGAKYKVNQTDLNGRVCSLRGMPSELFFSSDRFVPAEDCKNSKEEYKPKRGEVFVGKREDRVNHPTHYTSHPSGIECIEITKHYDFLIGNVIKYCWRAGLKKDGTTDELQDLQKAKWYLEKKIEELKKNK